MTCAVCGKEGINIHDDGGCAIMMAFCIGNNANLSNNCYCKDCYELLVRPHFKAYSIATGLYIAGLNDEEESS